MVYRFLIAISLFVGCETTDDKADSQQPVFDLEKGIELDAAINESSGIVAVNGKLLTHNDSRGTPQLFEINSRGEVTSILNFENGPTLYDWEDITADEDFIYIGDIGNNAGSRESLQIFKLPLNNLGGGALSPGIVEFRFADQQDFDNPLNQTSYDAEALTALDGDFYVFTKDWLELNTAVYRVKNQTGLQSLDPIATLNIGGLVTGATATAAGEVVLCGYSTTLSPFIARVAIDDEGVTLLDKIDLSGLIDNNAQIEGIAFQGSDDNGVETFFLTSEQFEREIAGRRIKFPAAIYKLRWR
jgi:hypothetical protein